jgi:hypothetical protein
LSVSAKHGVGQGKCSIPPHKMKVLWIQGEAFSWFHFGNWVFVSVFPFVQIDGPLDLSIGIGDKNTLILVLAKFLVFSQMKNWGESSGIRLRQVEL